MMNRPDYGEDDGATAKEINKVENFVPKGVLGDSFLRLFQNDQSDVVDNLR